MSPTGPLNKGRIAGVALLGIAAAALVVGIVMAVSGGPVSNTANGGSSSNTPGAPSSSGSGKHGVPSGSSGPSNGKPSAGPTSSGSSAAHAPSGSKSSGNGATTVVPPPDSSGGGGQGRGQAAQPAANYKKTPVRVYNNSKIRDLASRAAAEFRADGYNVTHVGNWPYGVIPHTTMYYRKGTAEKATAEALAKEFGARAEPRFKGIRDSSPGVVVIVTKDFSGAQQK